MVEPIQNGDTESITLLCVEQVAHFLGVHKRTVWRMVAAGELPDPIRFGTKVVRWRLSDLQQHISQMSG